MRTNLLAIGLVVLLIMGVGTAQEINNGQPQNVRSEISGTVKIRSILPDGTQVKKHQLVCELDDEEIKERLQEQRRAVVDAELDLEEAKKALEFTELLLAEAQKVKFREARESALRVTKAANDDLKEKLQALFDAVEDFKNSGDIADLEDQEVRLAERQVVIHVLDLVNGYSTRDMHEARTEYLPTRQQLKLNELRADIERARAKMFGKERDLTTARIEVEKLNIQVEFTKVFAPFDGIIRYAEPEVPEDRGIGKGSIVREGQPIFVCIPIKPNESRP